MTLNYWKRDRDPQGAREQWVSLAQSRQWSYRPRAWGSDLQEVKAQGRPEEQALGGPLDGSGESRELRGRAAVALEAQLRGDTQAHLSLCSLRGGCWKGHAQQRADPGGERPCSYVNSETGRPFDR